MSSQFSAELADLEDASVVTVTGFVVGTRRFRDRYSVTIKDPFGTVIIQAPSVSTEESPAIRAKKGDRVRATGQLAWTADQKPIVHAYGPLEILGNAAARLADLSAAMREQASRILLARSIRLLSDSLRGEGFVEFDSRVISTRWADTGLEPLQIHYPGFGGMVPLATSPAAQVTELINTTGASRAFTVATSFSTTYRFPDAGAELRVVVGKAVDWGLVELTQVFRTVLDHALSKIRVDRTTDSPSLSEGVFMEEVDLDVARGAKRIRIVRAVSPDGKLLAEGASEAIGDGKTLAGFTLYPSNLLTMLSATPTRNLQDLRAFNVW